jgi:hypothetical protein
MLMSYLLMLPSALHIINADRLKAHMYNCERVTVSFLTSYYNITFNIVQNPIG